MSPLKSVTPQRRAAASEQTSNLLVRLLKEGALIGLGAICLYLLIAMVSYDPNDPGWSKTGENLIAQNAGGAFGAWIADVFFSLFGYIAYLFPVMIAYRAWLVLRDRTREGGIDWLFFGLRAVGLVLVIVAGTGIAAMHYSDGPSVLPYSDRKSTRLNSSHVKISYAVFCL